MDPRGWMARIGYDGLWEHSAETLRRLQVAHLFAVPFENLDIHLGRPIVLDPAGFYRKIVGERRGGFCFELNGLFATMLEALGFRVTLLGAAVMRENGTYCGDLGHLTLRVDLEEPWLADVGFGDSFLEPLRLVPEVEQGDFRLTREGGMWTMWRRKESWREQYRFTLEPRRLEQFTEMCLYDQTSPESSFVQKRLATIAVPGGRITLTGPARGAAGFWRMIATGGGQREERILRGEAEFLQLLREKLGISLGGG